MFEHISTWQDMLRCFDDLLAQDNKKMLKIFFQEVVINYWLDTWGKDLTEKIAEYRAKNP